MADDSAELDPAAVRVWAAAQGIEVSARGRLPAVVVAGYRDAHPGEAAGDAGDDDPPGPDWESAAVAGEDDPGAGPPPPPGGAAAPPTPPGPPPPADLAEARERISAAGGKRKARPSWAGSSRAKTPRQAAPPPKLTRQVQQDIEGKIALLIMAPVGLWAVADPVCGNAAADNMDNVISKAMPIILRSPTAIRLLTEGTTYFQWLDLIMAAMPIGSAVWAHHVAGTVTVVDGQPVPATRLADGRVVPVQQQPQQAPDYSAYSTQVYGHVPQPRPA